MTIAPPGPLSDPSQPASGVAAVGQEAPWSRVEFAPPAAWVEAETYDENIPAKDGAHLTHLLWARQVDAGTGRSFHATALRLETALAVQHESQWNLAFDPRTQRVTLHWLRVVREGRRIDQLDRARVRLIQRENQLEKLVIDGTWTLLTVLEDVRPGDVLESAFSLEAHHPIRGEGCEVFFGVPPQAVVGRFRLTVNLPAGAGLAWRAAADAPARVEETLPAGGRRWVWAGAQTEPREPEVNQPSQFLDHVWVQVSDLASWAELSQLTATAWARVGEGGEWAEHPALARPERVDAAAVNTLVERLQDDFRYLSVALDAGGWIPAAPAVVARRRYGDCKDLAWLAATVLRRWGVAARPILVGTGLRGALAELLPMAGLLNHAILEVEVDGVARWFDLTERGQGGDFAGRAVGWFEQGVPVEAGVAGLRSQPGERSLGVYALRETLLLDTTRDGLSLAEQRVRAEGWQADNLRRARLGSGAEEFAKARENDALRRYGKVKRLGEVEWRDDRAANICELVEVFEIARAVYPDERGQRALFDVPPNLVTQGFVVPDDKARRGPWSMPFPCELRHEIEVRAPSMTAGGARRRRWDEAEFLGTVDEPRKKGIWSKCVRFTVRAEAVKPERITPYRRQLEEFFRETGWRIFLPWGQARPHRPDNFGRLQPPGTGPEAYVAPGPVVSKAPAATVPPPLPAARKTQPIENPKLGRGESGRPRRVRVASGKSAGGSEGDASAFAVALLRYGWIVVALVLLGFVRGCAVPG